MDVDGMLKKAKNKVAKNNPSRTPPVVSGNRGMEKRAKKVASNAADKVSVAGVAKKVAKKALPKGKKKSLTKGKYPKYLGPGSSTGKKVKMKKPIKTPQTGGKLPVVGNYS